MDGILWNGDFVAKSSRIFTHFCIFYKFLKSALYPPTIFQNDHFVHILLTIYFADRQTSIYIYTIPVVIEGEFSPRRDGSESDDDGSEFSLDGPDLHRAVRHARVIDEARHTMIGES